MSRSASRSWLSPHARRLRRIPVALAAFALIATACGDADDGDGATDDVTADDSAAADPDDASDESSDDAPAGDNTIKIHANLEFSGPGALYGVSKAIGMNVMADRLNEEGGVDIGGETYMIEIIECDNRSEASYGIQCAQEAVEEGVHITAAPDLGFEGAYEIFKENDILTIGNGGVASDLLNNEIEEHPTLTFEFLTYGETVESNLKQLRALFPEAETIGTMLPNDANGQVQDAAYLEMASEYGFEVVAQQLHPTDASGDLSTYLTALRDADPDVIHLGYYPQVIAAALEQGADLDAATIFTGDGLTFQDLEGVTFDGYPFLGYQYGSTWFEGFEPDDAEQQELIAAFAEEAGDEPYMPSIVVGGMIGDLMFPIAAMQECGCTDAEGIAAAYPDTTYEGPFGPAEGLDNRAVDPARTPFVIDEDDEVTVYVFPTGLSDDYTDEYETENPLQN